MEFSPMALYSYFADKQALLTALALQGFEKLAKRLDSKVGRRAPLAALRMVLLDYIAYIVDNPIEYRNVFLSVETLAEWTGIHGAATILTAQQNFPFGSRRRYAEEVVATLLE